MGREGGRKMALLVATTAIVAMQMVVGQDIPPCMMALYPCQGYVMPRGTEQQPSSECCAAFAGTVKDQLPCVCSVLMNNSSPFVDSVNVSRATTLLSSCNLDFASYSCTPIDNDEEQPLPSTYRLSSSKTARSSLPPATPTVDTNRLSRDSLSTTKIVGIAVGMLLFLCFSIIVIALFWRIRRRRARRSDSGGTPPGQPQAPFYHPQPLQAPLYHPQQPHAHYPQPQHTYGRSTEMSSTSSEKSRAPQRMSLGVDPLMGTKSTFTFEELATATEDFARENLLGQGGFGDVHKGILPDGKEVAIKQLRVGSKQGEREFQAEVEIISRVHHRHLVSLVGYCIHENRRLLVYEFVPNGTLAFHLHAPGQPPMDWCKRFKIALGSAKGLAYLHEDCTPKIIHRDVKASNILLDSNFDAEVADFGLAKLAPEFETHVSTRIMGTIGYLAPEYASTGKLTEKSDVFSYGVVLLELITGHQPIIIMQDKTEESLVDWAKPLLTRALESNDYDELIDPRLEHNYDNEEMAHLVACAAACIRHLARKRPKMSKVVRVLEGGVSLDELHQGVLPGHSIIYSSSSSGSPGRREDMVRQRRTPGVQEHTSTEYSASDTSMPYSGEGRR